MQHSQNELNRNAAMNGSNEYPTHNNNPDHLILLSEATSRNDRIGDYVSGQGGNHSRSVDVTDFMTFNEFAWLDDTQRGAHNSQVDLRFLDYSITPNGIPCSVVTDATYGPCLSSSFLDYQYLIHTTVAPNEVTNFASTSLRADKCLRCRYKGRKCVQFGQACTECLRAELPTEICLRISLSGDPIFQKWTNSTYASRLKGEKYMSITLPYTLSLCHYAGSLIRINCHEFIPSELDQITLWGKSAGGWKSVQTAAVHLATAPSDEELDHYVTACVKLCAQEPNNTAIFSGVLEEKCFRVGILFEALKLWTATRLLVRGWQVSQATPIDDPESPYFSQAPAARVLQNQLDHRLETYVAKLEVEILAKLDMREKKFSREQNIYTILILLAVIEKDIWRLSYWKFHKEEQYKWRHPDPAQRLIQRDVQYTNHLLRRLRIIGPITEGEMNRLGKVRNAKSSYSETDPNSLDGTLTRYAFGNNRDFVKEEDLYAC